MFFGIAPMAPRASEGRYIIDCAGATDSPLAIVVREGSNTFAMYFAKPMDRRELKVAIFYFARSRCPVLARKELWQGCVP
jgi:hypothetical protein